MKNKKQVWLLVLAGVLLACTAFLSERQSESKSELQQATRELDGLEFNLARNQIIFARGGPDLLSRVPDSLKDSIRAEKAAVAEALSRDSAAVEGLRKLIPSLREKLLWERIATWGCGICGVLFLMVFLRRVHRTRSDTG